MTIKQDQLDPQTTSVTFEDLHNDITPARYIHNGSDFIKCEFDDDPANPILRYYQTDGDKAAAFAMERTNILDLSYEPNSGNYFTVRYFIDSETINITNSTDDTTVTGVNRTFDNFDSDNELFIPSPGSPSPDPIFFRDLLANPGKLTLQRTLGSPVFEESVRSSPDGKDDTLISGVNDSGLFTSSVNYEMPLASIVGAQDSILSLRTYDSFNDNERFSVGVLSSGSGNSETLEYTVALDNTEAVSTLSLTRFEFIEANHKGILDWRLSTGLSSFTVTITSSGYANVGGNPNDWSVTTPFGTDSFVPFTKGQGYEDDFIKVLLVNPETPVGGDDVIASGVETITFDVYVDVSQNSTTTGTLSISRTSGTSPIISNDATGYSYSYDIFDFLANEELYQDIYGYTEQFDLVSGLLDNYTITSGSVQNDQVDSSTTLITTIDKTQDRRLNVEEIDDEGNVLNTILADFNVLEPLVTRQIIEDPPSGPASTTFSGVISGTESLVQIGLATSDSSTGFLRVFDSIHAFTLSAGTYPGSTLSGTSAGIVTSTGISGSSLDFQFNPNSGGFLQYQTKAAGENLLRTLDITGSSGVSNSSREVFLNFPDSHLGFDLPVSSGGDGIGDHVFLHGNDPNTLFYFRRNGDNLNVLKVDSTGTIAGLILNDGSADFVISNVQKGDDIYIASEDAHFIVDEVLDANNVRLETAPSSASYSYRLYAGAEQLQFNIDTSLSAFASVNVDDFSLRAGTSDNTTVTAQVINAWGDELSGKSVSFIVSNGDGAVSPANDTTDGNGEATTVYTAGVTPGPVEITATVSD